VIQIKSINITNNIHAKFLREQFEVTDALKRPFPWPPGFIRRREHFSFSLFHRLKNDVLGFKWKIKLANLYVCIHIDIVVFLMRVRRGFLAELGWPSFVACKTIGRDC